VREPIKEPAVIVAFGTSAATWRDISNPRTSGGRLSTLGCFRYHDGIALLGPART